MLETDSLGGESQNQMFGALAATKITLRYVISHKRGERFREHRLISDHVIYIGSSHLDVWYM